MESEVSFTNPTPQMRSAMRGLVHSDGWRLILLLLTAELRGLQNISSGPMNAPADMRVYAMERQEALLRLVQRVYELAEEDNPFAVARHALTSRWAEPFKQDIASKDASVDEKPPRRMPTYGAGGVR